MQVNVSDADTQLSRLLELLERGETVILARHGKAIAELVWTSPHRFPLGIASEDPLVPPGDKWWQPITDEETDDWIRGR